MNDEDNQIAAIAQSDKNAVTSYLNGTGAFNFSATMRQIINELAARGTYQAYNIGGYSRKDIIDALNNPIRDAKIIAEISDYTFWASGVYKSLVLHMSNMLTLDYVVDANFSHSVDFEDINIGKFRKKFDKIVDMHDSKMNIRHEFGKILEVVVRDGIYYGYAIEDEQDFFFQRLPTEYCSSVQVQDGTYNVTFSLAAVNEGNIDCYPPEIADAWRKRVKYGNVPINYVLDPRKAICIRMDDTIWPSLPFYAPLLREIYRLEDFKELQEARAEMDNYRILVLKIPFDAKSNTSDAIKMTDPAIEKFTSIANEVVPQNLAILPTPMEPELIQSDKDTAEKDTIKSAMKQVYNDAGTSELIFNTDTATALLLSLEKDAAVMYRVLRQIERWINRRVKLSNISTNEYKFFVSFMDVTVYNRDKVFERHYKAAQQSFPNKMRLARLLGINQSQLRGADFMENFVFQLDKYWVPPKSTYTQSSTSDENGRPTMPLEDLSDKGAITRENDANNREVT